MNPEIKAQWVAALRSGDYKQGKHFLNSVDHPQDGVAVNRFCCLGVLCDLAVKAGIGVTGNGTIDSDSGQECVSYGDGNDDSYTFLPRPVMAWAGLNVNNPDIAVPGEEDEYGLVTSDLADQNDGGKSFTEIADLIETQL